ncbi:hypothetical protein FDECE_15999 [Fusarium decemcellulare]|nr:hypothetical protein FDECE_15999 [Fusarium decemcellulare]
MLSLRAGALLNFIFGRQYAGIPREIDATDSASLVERAPVAITETVMESYTVVVPKTTTVEVTYHVPLNTSTSATSATLPFASTAIANSTSVTTTDPSLDTPLFASIDPALLQPETQESEQVPTTVAGGDAVPERTSDVNDTTAPIETETAAQPTSEEAPAETPDEARLADGQDSTSEVLLFDSASLTFSGPSSELSTTLQTRSGTTTAASAPESTQSSDGPIPDDSETGITDPRPSFTTATLPGGLLTTIGLDATAGNDQASETDPADGDVISQESNGTASTPVVVGSVLGSLMGLSMLFFLFWFLRRRSTRHRRSTLLTPLGIPPGAPGNGGEKYEIDNHSLGPTPRSTKLAAAVTVNAKKFGRRLRLSTSGSANINMNRGNSQFLDSNPSHSRSASMGHYSSRASSSPDGHQGWWSRLIQESSAEDIAAQEDRAERGRETTRTPSPNPFSDANAMAAAPRGNPFSDVNSLPRDSLVPSPLAPGRSPPQRPPRPDDPFSDVNSVTALGPARLPPATYVTDVRRSRGPSMMRNLTPPGQTTNPSLAPPARREAGRDNIHSNPFDLELDGRHVPSMSNIHPMPRYTAASSVYPVPKRTTTHSRAESFTSRYTSGVSMMEQWPGVPNGSSRYSGAGYPPLRHSRSESDSVLGRQSVGQAF